MLAPLAALRRRGHHGDPQLGRLRKRETFWHHPDDGIGPFVEFDLTADHTTIRTKGPLPQTVTQHHLLLVADGIISGQEGTAHLRPFVKHVEEVCAYLNAQDSLRITCAGHIEAAPAAGGDRFERPALLLPVFKVPRSHSIP